DIADGMVHCIVAQANGRIVLGGSFTQITTGTAPPAVTPSLRIARLLPPHYGLNTNWTVDPYFAPGGADGPIRSIIVVGDGSRDERFFVGGSFTRITGVIRTNLARLDGARAAAAENAFDPSPNGEVKGLALQPDGTLLLAGSFTELPASALRYIARL